MITDYFNIFLLSMIPIGELRFSIPYGILKLSLDPIYVFLTSVFGNICIGIIVLYIIGPIMFILRKNRFFNFLIGKIFKRTRVKGKIVYTLKFYGLIIFILIPFPLTGVWTGSLASYLFGLTKHKSVIAVFIGVMISGTIVTALTLFTDFYINL